MFTSLRPHIFGPRCMKVRPIWQVRVSDGLSNTRIIIVEACRTYSTPAAIRLPSDAQDKLARRFSTRYAPTSTAKSRIFGNSHIPILSRSRIIIVTFIHISKWTIYSFPFPCESHGNPWDSPMLALELIADAATTLHLATVATWRFVRITYNGNSLIKTKRSAKRDCSPPGYSPRRLLVVVN